MPLFLQEMKTPNEFYNFKNSAELEKFLGGESTSGNLIIE